MDQIDDAIVGGIPPAVARMKHGNTVVWPQSSRPGPIENDGPFAAMGSRDRCDVVNEPKGGLGAVAPPSIRSRSHHIVAVHENNGHRRH